MTEVTVRCTCTRTMQPDTFAGVGRYRCGCGARIAILGLPRLDAAHCAIPRGNRICNGPKTPEARACQPCTVMIARLALDDPEVVLQLADAMAAVQFHQARQAQLELLRAEERTEGEEFNRHQDARRCCVVYYCRTRPGVIKIGTTVRLAARMERFRVPAEEVLAAEPGSYKLENLRHRQFGHLRMHHKREDFTHGDDLQAHMDKLVKTHGRPYDLVDTIYRRQVELASRASQS